MSYPYPTKFIHNVAQRVSGFDPIDTEDTVDRALEWLRDQIMQKVERNRQAEYDAEQARDAECRERGEEG